MFGYEPTTYNIVTNLKDRHSYISLSLNTECNTERNFIITEVISLRIKFPATFLFSEKAPHKLCVSNSLNVLADICYEKKSIYLSVPTKSF